MNGFFHVVSLCRVREVQRRLAFTLGAIFLYRAGHRTVFALGLQPFIAASIVMQLLVRVVPSLERIREEDGEEGRAKLERWTKFGAVGIAAVQALAQHHALPLALVAGSAVLIWIAEQVTRRGLGNGPSVLITADIVARAPAALAIAAQTFELDRLAPAGFVKMAGLSAALAGVTALVVTMHDAVRRIPVRHAPRGAGAIPLKVNQGGVMPVIFASSALMAAGVLVPALRESPRLWLALEAVLIVLFAYFYAGLEMDPRELANRMRRQGAFAPGVRAGAPTARYLDRVLQRVTLAGGVFLAALALAPHALAWLFGAGLASAGLGGTSLLIVVGVTLEAVRQLESHALARQYHRVVRT